MARSKLSHIEQAFRIQNGIQAAVSTANKLGVPVDLPDLMACLRVAYPDADKAPNAMEAAVYRAAAEANVPVRAIRTLWTGQLDRLLVSPYQRRAENIHGPAKKEPRLRLRRC